MIHFKILKYKNFMSVGNTPIELYLDRFDKTLLTGKNGHGKSQNYIALYYALYGKVFSKGLVLAQMINSLNQKKLVVEVEFSIGKNEYKVVRGLKPNIFQIWINGTKKEQDANIKDYQKFLETNILKMTSKTFKQIVILGSTAYVPFMRLSAKDRRDVIEDLLDIQYFTIMSELAKKRVVSMREDIGDLTSKINQLDTRVEVTASKIEELNDHNDNVIGKNEEEISKHSVDLLGLETQKSDLYAKTKEIDFEGSKANLGKLVKQGNELSSLKRQIQTNRNKSQKEIDFFDDITDCPTCLQNVEDDHKHRIISHNEDKIIKFDNGIVKAEEKLGEFNNDIEVAQSIIDSFSDYVSQMKTIDHRVELLEGVIASIKKQNIELSETVDTSESEKQLAIDKKELDGIRKTKNELTDELRYYTTVIELLKDGGIKTKIIKSYIPVINKYIQKYLDILDFNIEFIFDEQFNETIKSRGRDMFSYGNFSEGQKLRIDLAILFTFREVSRLKNSSSTNLLIFDEIGDSSLDQEGFDALMRILNSSAEDSNIFVISHNDNMGEMFKNTVRFELKNNFTEMTFVGEYK